MNQPGKPRVDDRREISGIPHIRNSGGRWRDVPAAYGLAKTIYNRYARWARPGIWQWVSANVAAEGSVPDDLRLDSTLVEAHRSAAGGKGGSSARRSASRTVAVRQRSIAWPMLVGGSSLSS